MIEQTHNQNICEATVNLRLKMTGSSNQNDCFQSHEHCQFIQNDHKECTIDQQHLSQSKTSKNALHFPKCATVSQRETAQHIRQLKTDRCSTSPMRCAKAGSFVCAFVHAKNEL